MKKGTLCLLSALLLGGLASCNGNNNGKKEIGVLQFGSFPALENAKKGFVDTLKESAIKDDINIVIKNADANSGNNATMASTLASTSDLVYGIATPSAKALKSSVDSLGSDIPVLFAAVTNPKGAALVDNLEAPEGNCTGVVDLGPYEQELEYATLFDGVDKISSFFTSTEVNSVYQADLAEAWMDSHNISHRRDTISNASEIKSKFAAIPDDVDAVFLPTDDTIADKIALIKEANRERVKPLIIVGSDVGMIEGCTFALGVDFYKCGVQAANLAISILKDGKKMNELPVERCDINQLMINRTEATELGITIPQALLDVEGAVIQ